MPRPDVRKLVIVAAAVGVPSLLGLAALVVVFGFVHPPPGDTLASVDVVPGQTFTVEWVSDGAPARAWLDFDCSGCGFPFTGRARIDANGTQVADLPFEVRRSNGYAVSSSRSGDESAMHGKLLFDVPAMRAGARARITGVLITPAPELVWSSSGRTTASPPRFELLRFWVAR